MNLQLTRYLLVALAGIACLCGRNVLADADPPADAGTNQIVVPEVARRDVQIPHIPSNDFDIGLYGGTYSTQDFGAHAVGGLKLGYALTEDFFVQGVYARTTASDQNYRIILPSGIFPVQTERLRYYDFSAGYNVLPGEVFIGSHYALPYTLYVVAGAGSTELVSQKYATFSFGAGFRVFFTDWVSMQIDARDHMFTMDLLGERERTQNLEFTLGLNVSF